MWQVSISTVAGSRSFVNSNSVFIGEVLDLGLAVSAMMMGGLEFYVEHVSKQSSDF